MKTNKRTYFYLFTAMVVSSLVIGSFCRTAFVPTDALKTTASAMTSTAIAATADSSPNKTDSKTESKTEKATQTVYPSVDVDMKPIQLAEHSWYVQGKAGMATDNAGFISNAGFVITDVGVVIFDGLGTPSLAQKLLGEIRKITDKPIVKVIVSHYHADHIYGLQVFKEQGAEIVAPEGVYEYLDSDAATSRLEERRFSLDPWVNDKTVVVIPDRIISKSETFTLGNINFTINVIGSAHSDGDMTLYVENDRVLFTGDIIFEGRVPFLGSNNTKHWLETLEKMETVKLHALVPGHGPAANNPTKAISLTRTYLAFLRKKMSQAVEDLIGFDEAYNAIDWSDYQSLPAFEAANRKNAFQVYLSLEEEGI